MRILLISFYYPPDIGPAPLRARSIVEALQRVGPPDTSIEVLTTAPNRYQSLHASAPDIEDGDGVSVRRFALPVHRSGMLDQAKAFASFAVQVLRSTENHTWDVVVATSSRLMTAALAAQVARRGAMPLYLDIRDLLTDTLGDVLSPPIAVAVLPLMRIVETWTFRRATRLNVVSSGFLPHMARIAPALVPTVHTNGVDEEFLPVSTAPIRKNRVPVVVYAGNMGEGQGLHRIVPAAAALAESSITFRMIGDGGRRLALERALQQANAGGVELLKPMPRQDLLKQYRDADILLLHLNDYPAFRKVLPSKIFEYAATGKPILAGVAGYAATFLREQVPGAVVFEPCNADAMLRALATLLDGPASYDRNDFCRRYSRSAIMREVARDILSTAGQD